MISKEKSPIGVFDSGIGGLTVVSAIKKRMPGEDILYLGDTARVPYGTKSAETVVRYAHECAEFLLDRKVKAIVVACNTASAHALGELSKELNVPVIGVIEPGARAAIDKTKNNKVGVVGTQGTIASNAYGKALKSLSPDVSVISRACPLFVPLVEEGWIDNDVTFAAAKRYLHDMNREGIDVLILGCTHYPLLKAVIAEQMGDGVALVDSAETTSAYLEKTLRDEGLTSDAGGSLNIYVTDLPARFESVAAGFLGDVAHSVSRVEL